MTLDLPTGLRGRLLALAISFMAALILAWSVVLPLWGWYADRQAALEEQAVLARHMDALAARLPELRREARDTRPGVAAASELIPAGSDAIAAAILQERIQPLASQVGIALSSVEILPAAASGDLRRIGLRITLDADLAKLARLLGAIEAARPQMLVGDLILQRRLVLAEPDAPDVSARFTVFGFRSR